MKKLSSEQKRLIIISIITSFIVHLPLYTKNILTADVILNNGYYKAFAWEISLGRFGLYLTGLLKSFLTIPHLEIFLSTIILAFISLMIINLFNIKNKLAKIITTIFFIVAPSISATLLFNYCSLAYTIAFFFSIMAIYSLVNIKHKYLKYVISIISVIISMSIYQSFIQVIFTLIILLSILKLLDNTFNIKKFFLNIFIIFIGIISYYLIMKLSLIVFNINLSSYSGANSFGLGTILNIPTRIFDCYQTFYNYFFTNKIVNNTNIYNHIVNIFLLTITLISLITTIIKNKLTIKNIIYIIILVLCLPLAINFIILLLPGTKIQLLMSMAYLLIIPFTFTFTITNNIKLIKYFLIVILVILLRNYIIQDSATYMSLETTYNKTYTIASDLVRKINEFGYDKKVMITGSLDNNSYYKNKSDLEVSNIYNLNYGFIANYSLFWDEYVNIKNGWSRYLYEYLGVSINFVDSDNYNEILKNDEFKKMNIYPDEDSIKVINDIIVIKLAK